MASLVKQSSTQLSLKFLMVQSSDHITGLTGASPTVTIRKEGGSFASPSGAVSEIASGWYQVAGNATDTNTLGEILLHATAASGDPTDIIAALVVAFDPQAGSLSAAGNTAIADAMFDESNGVETGLTMRQSLRLISATTGAKLSGAGTGTETFRNAVADSANRVVASVDVSGNRTAITYNL